MKKKGRWVHFVGIMTAVVLCVAQAPKFSPTTNAAGVEEENLSTLNSDANEDNRVDTQDLLNLLNEWQKGSPGDSANEEASGSASDGPEPQATFETTPAYREALTLFGQGSYAQAGESFARVIASSSQEEESADAAYHRAFCFYLVGDYPTFNQLADAFHARYPNSHFR